MELTENKEAIAAFREKAKKLVSQMTLEEKVSQMVNHAAAVERLGIKAYDWWNEALHGVARAGVATVFPQAIGMAASFDEDLLEEVGEVVSTEARAKFNVQQQYNDTDIYKGLTVWAPNVNIFRDPRWGRGHETYGEDPFLTSRLGVRYIKGLQGHDEKHLKLAACAKHFAVHSGPEGVRHSFNAKASKQDMYETYLPAFKACVQEAKVETVMGAYNRTNGEACCGSKTLLQDILRKEWGFEGHVVTDCWAIKDFHEGHHVTKNALESVALAMNSGSDLNCGNLFHYLGEAVEKGLITEERLDEALTNLFTTRMKLGLLDDQEKTPWDDLPYTVVDQKKYREFNREVAQRTLVLLKNEKHILPLQKDMIGTIGVIGPNADSRDALVGNYEGTASRYVTVLEGLEDYLGDDVRILYSEGCHLYKEGISNLSEGNDRISEVKAVCAASDIVLCCLGLDAHIEGEEGDVSNQYGSGDKGNLDLPGLQGEILKAAVESGKPVIVLLLSGSALAVNYAQEHAAAVMQCWYPGSQGGLAIARVLFGDENPEGKLPVTFYKTTEELPDFEDYSMKNRTYRYMKQDALYPFGYGLSYTEYELGNVKTSAQKVSAEGLDISAVIENKGLIEGRETLQVYVKVPGENTPNAQLKGLKKVKIGAGEKTEVKVHLPKEAFGLFDENGKLVYSQKAEVYVGTQAPDHRSEELTGKRPVKIEVEIEA